MYSPGISYIGDKYVAQAGQAISDDISEALKRWHQTQQDTAAGRALISQAGTPELLAQYDALNATDNLGMARGYQLGTEQKLKQAQIEYYRAHGDAQDALAETRRNEKPFAPYGTTVTNSMTGETVPVWMSSPNSAIRFDTGSKGSAAGDDSDSFNWI